MGRYKIEMSFAELSMKSGPSSKKDGDSVNFLDPFRAGYVVSWKYSLNFERINTCLIVEPA